MKDVLQITKIKKANKDISFIKLVVFKFTKKKVGESLDV